MKKFGKFILGLVLVFGVGFTGFIIGGNYRADMEGAIVSKEDEHIKDMNLLKALIDQNFLFDYKEEDLYQGSLKGMYANLGDPYTEYFTKDEFSKLMESLNGRYKGIGVVVQASKEGLIQAVQIFKDSPAEEAGIKVGDYLIKVDGIEYSGSNMDEAVANIKGDEGTSVKITVLRTSEDNPKGEELEFEVERRELEVDTVDSRIVEEDGKNIGYLHIRSFDDITDEEFDKEYKQLKDQGIDGLLLDLRNNPGGALDVCLNIADTFLDKGVIVTTEDKNGDIITEESDEDHDDIPITVLINENSASASEILAGALKDRGRAKLVGTKTFGKGIVQKIFPLEDGSGAKITVSEYHTPSGAKINKVGIEPDIKAENKDKTYQINPDNFDDDEVFNMGLVVLLEEIGE
ncbi:S41 family peptidase [Anaerococcus sp. AGMB09787]|uniref:S41 family peptidase n=1 Tax=Anaerococcus sp. AGMB09787 TaxID=2922869 RepID=UPI001FAFAB96|nr:S41 family peptidase [Anaerococcus sp. AGMB09787]